MIWVRFLMSMQPELLAVARELYVLCQGDPQMAKAQLRRIRDHGVLLEQAELELDRRRAAMREKA